MTLATPDAAPVAARPVAEQVADIAVALAENRVVPYLGPGVLDLVGATSPVPRSTGELVAKVTLKAAVPGRIRHNLTAATQYIESHRHRKTLERILNDVFAATPEPTVLHRWLAGLTALPLIVDDWYDATTAAALAGRTDWVQIQGLSHPQSNGEWVRTYDPSGTV